MTPILEIKRLSKSFGTLQALKDFSFQAYPQMIHALIGENGAGKSTLMNLLSGVYHPNVSHHKAMFLHGKPFAPKNPHDARQQGISTIFQEFTLLPNLSIAENLFLGKEQYQYGTLCSSQMQEQTRHILNEVQLHLDPQIPVAFLSVGQCQMVEIAKGILFDADVFIFDEPTQALSAAESKLLFQIIRQLKQQQKSIFYISHHLEEVFQLSDDVTVMKDGEQVITCTTQETSIEEVIPLMVGRTLENFYPPKQTSSNPLPLLQLNELQTKRLKPTSCVVHSGEIVGLAGLEGQGQHELMRAIAGHTKTTGGSLQMHGKNMTTHTPPQRVRASIGFLPEDRKHDGVFPSLSVENNLLMAGHVCRHLWQFVQKQRSLFWKCVQSMQIKITSPMQNVMELSGGNQQKILLARWFACGVNILLCEEPTRGIDIGSKTEIYHLLTEYTQKGNGVLISSRDIPELLGLCHRIYVMLNFQIVAILEGEALTEHQVLQTALGEG